MDNFKCFISVYHVVVISGCTVVIRLVNRNTVMQIIQVASTAEPGNSGNTSRKRTELMRKSYTSPLLEPLNSTDKRLSTQAPHRSNTLLHSFHGKCLLSRYLPLIVVEKFVSLRLDLSIFNSRSPRKKIIAKENTFGETVQIQGQEQCESQKHVNKWIFTEF